MLNFSNPGEIDIRAATIMGVNAKSGDSPIGFFGTGLKYAIAATLRLGGSITIHSGETEYIFRSVPDTIRDKQFNFIQVLAQNSDSWQTLGFTTDLGKAWEPWMVYRELWSNMKDEGGELLDATLQPAPGLTQIVVDCEALDEVAKDASSFLIATEPLASSDSLSIHPGQGLIFYQGIRVGETEKPSLFNFNVKSHLDLTEDRTLKYTWQFNGLLKTFYQRELADETLLRRVITASKDLYERQFDFNYASASARFQHVARKVFSEAKAYLHPSLFAVLRKEEQRSTALQATIPAVQIAMIEKAKKFLHKTLGITIEAPIYIQELGSGTLACTEGNDIFLDPQLFEGGSKMVAIGLYEEHLHITKGFVDESRQFQTFLITKVISLCEQIQGEPL